MCATLKLIVMAVITAGLLTGCGDDGKYQGKTAQEWAAEAERNKGAKTPVPGKLGPVEQQLEADKKLAEQQKEAKKNYLAAIDGQAVDLEFSKDGDPLITLATTALRKSGVTPYRDGDEIVLGHADAIFDSRFMSAIRPDKVGVDVSYEVVREARSKLSGAIISWATSGTKNIDLVWSALRPVLRQQYDLLKTLRGHEMLFRTAYSRRSFEPLADCLLLHEKLTEPSDTKIEMTDKDIKRCSDVFKKWGVKVFEANPDDIKARNALWIVRFLARREADGGEKFAQQFQKLALDYIKP